MNAAIPASARAPHLKVATEPVVPASAISNGIVRLFRERAGRGPTKAKTLITSELVVVTLRDCLTTAERTLLECGAFDVVKQTRDALHDAVEADARTAVEAATGRRVVAYMASQHDDPEIGVLVFIFGPAEA